MPEAVHYRVSMLRPHTHLFEVRATFPPGPDTLEAVLPVWTPGSYMVREFSRHLQEVRATGPDGEALAVRRTDKRTWRVDTRGRAVTLSYRVYAHELSVRTSHLDGGHGYFNGACLFLYTEATRGLAHHVTVEAPEGWKTFTALDFRDGAFVADSYDELVDSPFEVGPHTPLTFVAAGVPHEVVVWGDSAPDPARLCADLQRVCEAQARLFGGLPMKRYLFLVYLTDKGRGGLEHQASTALLFPRVGLYNPRGWEDFLTLAAHEYFHLWNIKRVKPRAFVPMDYAQENYTSLLWAFEGVTAYYDNRMVLRAGLMSASRYLIRLGGTPPLLRHPRGAARGFEEREPLPHPSGGDAVRPPGHAGPQDADAGRVLVPVLGEALPPGREQSQQRHLLLPQGRGGGGAAGPGAAARHGRRTGPGRLDAPLVGAPRRWLRRPRGGRGGGGLGAGGQGPERLLRPGGAEHGGAGLLGLRPRGPGDALAPPRVRERSRRHASATRQGRGPAEGMARCHAQGQHHLRHGAGGLARAGGGGVRGR